MYYICFPPNSKDLNSKSILILTKKVPYPPTDGESLVIMADIAILKKLGYKVHILALNTKKHFVSNVDSYSHLDLWDSFRTTYIDTSLNILILLKYLFNSFPLHLSRFYSPEYQTLLEETIRAYQIDTVLSEGLTMTIYLHGKDTPNKKIYRAHNIEFQIWETLRSENILKRIAYRLIFNELKRYETKKLAKINQHVFLSKDDQIRLKRYYPHTSTREIPITIAGNYKKKYDPLAANGILFLGSLDWLPNQEGLTWFLTTIYPKIDHIPLSIAGKGQFSLSSPNITIIENFKSAEDLMASHKILIVPLLSGSGIRIKILEAMSFGLPVISTEKGAEGIISEHLIKIDDPDSFANKVLELYSNNNFLQDYSVNLLSDFNISYSESQVEKLWHDELNSGVQ